MLIHAVSRHVWLTVFSYLPPVSVPNMWAYFLPRLSYTLFPIIISPIFTYTRWYGRRGVLSSRPTSGCRRKIPRRLREIVLSRDASEIIRDTRGGNQFLYSTHQIFFLRPLRNEILQLIPTSDSSLQVSFEIRYRDISHEKLVFEAWSSLRDLLHLHIILINFLHFIIATKQTCSLVNMYISKGCKILEQVFLNSRPHTDDLCIHKTRRRSYITLSRRASRLWSFKTSRQIIPR